MSPQTVTFQLPNRLTELPALRQRLNDFLPALPISERCLFQLHLILEEVFTNIVSHGYPQPGDDVIQIRLTLENDELVLCVEDRGVPFNPLASRPPDIDGSAQNRKIGGLGIHLIKNFTNAVDYQRCGGKNVLTLRKRLEVQP